MRCKVQEVHAPQIVKSLQNQWLIRCEAFAPKRLKSTTKSMAYLGGGATPIYDRGTRARRACPTRGAFGEDFTLLMGRSKNTKTSVRIWGRRFQIDRGQGSC